MRVVTNIWYYIRPLPAGVNEVVFPDPDGWTIWISDRLDAVEVRNAYRHALEHINNGDFDRSDADQIERDRH